MKALVDCSICEETAKYEIALSKVLILCSILQGFNLRIDESRDVLRTILGTCDGYSRWSGLGAVGTTTFQEKHPSEDNL